VERAKSRILPQYGTDLTEDVAATRPKDFAATRDIEDDAGRSPSGSPGAFGLALEQGAPPTYSGVAHRKAYSFIFFWSMTREIPSASAVRETFPPFLRS
jgi:hypothetical protein